jgi:UDP-N-acetylglucosamine acyltransferase
MTSTIHPTAVIAQGAKIGASVSIGPYCVIGEQVTLADRVRLVSHVAVDGQTDIGEDTEIFPFASIGHRPQDKKFKGENSRLIIGQRNVIREHVTMNPGTEGGGLITQVGNDCLFMASAHVAHDCIIGNNVILANNATVAGHVHVGDGVILGGLSAVHQFVRIGNFAFIGGMAAVEKDVIPYGMVVGERAHLAGLNLVGLKRRNVEREAIHALRNLYKQLFLQSGGTLNDRATSLNNAAKTAEEKQLLDFILNDSSRSFCTPALHKTDSREAA